ncbi:Protein DGCR6, partial [Armadillidium nasatum]
MNSSDKQNLLYTMLDKLKIMAQEIPSKYQLRLPYDVLSSLAQLLLDNTVFEIVKELVDLQRMTEIHLYQQRQEMIRRHKCEKENNLKNHKQEIQKAKCQGRYHVLQRLPALHSEQLLSV